MLPLQKTIIKKIKIMKTLPHKSILFFLVLINISAAQFGANPAEPSAQVLESARAGEVINIDVTVTMADKWHIYGVHGVSGGPIATRITVEGDAVKKLGSVQEPEPQVKFDEGFQVEIRYHAGTTKFNAAVLLESDLSPGKYELQVSVLYQTCDEHVCYPPVEKSLPVIVDIEAGEPREGRSELMAAVSMDSSGNIDLDKAIQEGFFSFILLALSMGFLALLTPCVFPMIPITVSYFTHQGELEGRNPIKQASVYAIGIILTFSILGLLLALTLGAAGANQLAANPWVNLFIGILFIYFALSLFGMYEIQLPGKLRAFTLKQEGRSGYVGTLFMALTFTLTSFTCTVQFVGLLLVAAAQGQWFWPSIGMLVFSAAFALPFFFLALFPQYLAKLPQSGGWLNSVKVVMGFLELAAAFKFLSNSDLVWEWNIFTHTAVLAAWTIIILLTGIYLLGKLRLPHDSELGFVTVPRMLLSMFFLTFALYLGSGLFGQPIHGLIYSYLPPKLMTENRTVSTNGSIHDEFKWHKELESAFVEAERQQKPVFVDFTGYTCTNCRWMEANVFTHPEVKARFGEFILVQLYTDGGENYREHQAYEIERFGTASLPFYVILSPEDDELARFPGMSRNIDEFINFLDKGLAG